nr:uncharacterized protein LOC122271822 [Parasteatoda tepidariorum]
MLRMPRSPLADKYGNINLRTFSPPVRCSLEFVEDNLQLFSSVNSFPFFLNYDYEIQFLNTLLKVFFSTGVNLVIYNQRSGSVDGLERKQGLPYEIEWPVSFTFDPSFSMKTLLALKACLQGSKFLNWRNFSLQENGCFVDTVQVLECQ